MSSVLLEFARLAAPSPTPAPTLNPELVTPGAVGFAAIFFVAVAVIFLIIDMTRRIRRVRYRAEIAEKLDAEQAAAAQAAAGGPAIVLRSADDPRDDDAR